MMSVRDAMYDAMFDQDNPFGLNRSAILVDIVHGGRRGGFRRMRCPERVQTWVAWSGVQAGVVGWREGDLRADACEGFIMSRRDRVAPAGALRSLFVRPAVSDHGAKLYAGFLAWGLRRQVLRMLKHYGGRLPDAAAAPPPPLIAPLNPDAAMEDWPTFCAEGQGLQKVVKPSPGGEWQWVDEGSSACPGCHKYGFASKKVSTWMGARVGTR